MKMLKTFTLLLVSVIFLSAQFEVINEGQMNALKILAERNGFIEQQLEHIYFSATENR